MRVLLTMTLACFVAALRPPALAVTLDSPLVVVDDQHVDLEVPYSGGAWNLHVNAADDGPMEANQAILHLNERTRTVRDAYEPWIGAAPGQTIWIAEQNSRPGELYLGLAARGCDSLASWLPNDARITIPFAYIQVALVAVRGYDGDADPANNPAAPGDFALWETSGSGAKTAWMSTAAALPDGNFYYMIPGGHAHLSWGFTAPGLYEVDLEARAYLGAGMTNPIGSDVVTFVFGVERPFPGDANLDDEVGPSDAGALAAHWLSSSPEIGWLEGDFNNDRTVDDLDLAVLAAHWSLGEGPTSSVPEPGIGAFATAGALVVSFLCARRRAHRNGARR
ncbi:MAG: TIGR03769 domain-containing protein [Pirellulales bacterium]|nr:TIGR03769 domain-containing protein [Pirellulales bacterium]